MKKLTLEIDGHSQTGYVQRVGETLWVNLNGETFTYEPELNGSRARRRRGQGAGAVSGDIVAPMPGKVTKIMVQSGQLIKAQETALVLEAMKMEYTLKVPAAGKVKALKCQVGDQVSLGQVLVQLEAELKV